MDKHGIEVSKEGRDLISKVSPAQQLVAPPTTVCTINGYFRC